MSQGIDGVQTAVSYTHLDVYKRQDGGWLTISRTEGYKTSLAQTTLYTYNDQFRVSLELSLIHISCPAPSPTPSWKKSTA